MKYSQLWNQPQDNQNTNSCCPLAKLISKQLEWKSIKQELQMIVKTLLIHKVKANLFTKCQTGAGLCTKC